MRAAILLTTALLTLGACAGPAHDAGFRPAAGPSTGFSQVGVASWYGGKFHGRKTASGERFNMNQMTAAHRNLPFGTRVRVTNLENGRQVVVTINDRGPFVRGRIIDVSRRAAGQLGFRAKGVTRVRIEALGRSG